MATIPLDPYNENQGPIGPVDMMELPANSGLIDPEAQIPAEQIANTIVEQPSMADMEALEAMNLEDPELLTPEELESIGAKPRLDEPGTDLIDPNAPVIDPNHYENLAKDMEDNDLDTIANDLIELVEADENSRSDWYDRVQKGIRNLGVSNKTYGGADFEGASTVVHPVLMEACTQFQARAIQEMWPSAGPVHTQVLGEQTPEKQDQAERVQNYMNYLYTVQMTEAFNQEDNMLLRLPISGSTFKKMYYDPLKKRLASIFVEPADFLISYQTTDLMSSPRFTHRIREYQNDVRKKEATGFYIKSKKGSVSKDTLHTEDTDKPVIIGDQLHRVLMITKIVQRCMKCTSTIT